MPANPRRSRVPASLLRLRGVVLLTLTMAIDAAAFEHRYHTIEAVAPVDSPLVASAP